MNLDSSRGDRQVERGGDLRVRETLGRPQQQRRAIDLRKLLQRLEHRPQLVAAARERLRPGCRVRHVVPYLVMSRPMTMPLDVQVARDGEQVRLDGADSDRATRQPGAYERLGYDVLSFRSAAGQIQREAQDVTRVTLVERAKV